jgi:hypothetical protein
VATGPGGSLEIVSGEIGEATKEVRSALEWAQVRAMAADGVSKSEIARRLGINRRTAKRLVETSEPPSYSRAPAGSKTGYRPGQVPQVDWAEMPTRPRIGGRERRVYELISSLPFSGAATAHFSST